jgi:hypothetical protein
MFSQVNAAVPAHEGEVRSFGADYDEFMKQQRNQRLLPLTALTNFMRNSLLSRTMSYGEHLDFQPVIEELAYYVVQWRNSHEPSEATLEQAKDLLEYGMQYDIRNQ